MVELAVDIFANVVRSMIDAVVNFIALPSPQAEDERLPTSSELRAFFERRAREQASQPPPVSRMQPAEGAVTPAHEPEVQPPAAPFAAATPAPERAEVVQPAPQPAPVAQTESKHEVPAPAPAPERHEPPTFVAQEAASNPNFGAPLPTPHPVEHTWESSPLSPARSGKVDVEEFHALHLSEPPQTPLVQHSMDTLPLSPARTGTVNAEEFHALHLTESAKVSAPPHSWDTLPLSPARFGDTGPTAHAATPAQPKAAAHDETPIAPGDKEPVWPSLPPWPPALGRPDDVQRSRGTLRDCIRTAWYV